MRSFFISLLLIIVNSAYGMSSDGYLEAYAHGSCPQGKKWASEFMTLLNKEPPRDSLLKFISAVEDRLKRKSLDLTDLEQVRLNLHLAAESGRHLHSSGWHDEIVNRCQSSGADRIAQLLSGVELLIPGEILFECTVLEVNSSAKENKTGPKIKKHSAIRADVVAGNKAVIQVGGFKVTLAPSSIQRNKKPDAEDLKLDLKDAFLFLHLKGKPLSRNGDFTLTDSKQRSLAWGRVTCH